MAEIKLNKRYKYAGDIVKALSNRLQWTLEDVTEFMNSIEDADVEEVPCRCEECKYYETYYHMCNRTGDYVKMKCDDFCSYGERG